ncbi:MAG TPA: thymidylate kinase [Ktedonobacterales bacterium]|nr:thymidylate kinase [Ktedonobacterales bacterium]
MAESSGYAVIDTGQRRSALAGRGIDEAKQGHTLGPLTMDLFYATDFVDRFENQILPALRAGFIVLTDRYIYSLMARAIVRGADRDWVKQIYGLALKPDAVFYLDIELDALIRRILRRGRFDYWESGMDMRLGPDLYESFIIYQDMMLKEFHRMATEYSFQVIDATRPIPRILADLQARMEPLLPAG